MFDGGLVAEIESLHRQESVLVARRLAVVAALLRQRVAAAGRDAQRREFAVIDGCEQTAAEVAAAMNLSAVAAGYGVSDAEALDTRLPQVAALLAQGRTDWRTVRLIIARTGLITDEALIARVDRSLAARLGSWRGWSRQRIVNAVDAAVVAVDPDAARQRRHSADTDRYLAVSPLANGMAEVYGTIAAATAKAFDRGLSQLAGQVCAADPRTLDQRRAGALAALIQGRALAYRCHQPGCPAAPPPTTQVVPGCASWSTSSPPRPPSTPTMRPRATSRATGLSTPSRSAPWPTPQPTSGSTRSSAPPRRCATNPPAALQRFIRCRDLTCRFPGCARPAEICDLDHTVAFNHHDPAAGGHTVDHNLKCLCRLHHRLKTFGGWRDTQLADDHHLDLTCRAHLPHPPRRGRPVRAMPTRLHPSGPTPRRPDPATTRPHHPHPRAQPAPTRPQQRNRRTQIPKPHARQPLRLQGTPSTSPFCIWVNQPREPEELPPDWTPTPSDLPPLPDDPPF